jgi:hypothetical protein
MVEVMTPLVSVKQPGDSSIRSLAALSFSLDPYLEVDLEAMSDEVVPMLNRRIKNVTRFYASRQIVLEVEAKVRSVRPFPEYLLVFRS